MLGSIDRDELHRRQVAARTLRHWVDGEGMVAGQFRLPPEVGVRFVNRLDAGTDRGAAHGAASVGVRGGAKRGRGRGPRWWR